MEPMRGKTAGCLEFPTDTIFKGRYRRIGRIPRKTQVS